MTRYTGRYALDTTLINEWLRSGLTEDENVDLLETGLDSTLGDRCSTSRNMCTSILDGQCFMPCHAMPCRSARVSGTEIKLDKDWDWEEDRGKKKRRTVGIRLNEGHRTWNVELDMLIGTEQYQWMRN